MIRAWIFLGVWAALPAQGQVGPAAIYTDFDAEPAPAVLQALQDEVDSLMVPNGLHFTWRSLPDDSLTTWTDLAVVKFSGRCEVLPLANSRRVQRLGWTNVSDRVVQPFAEIDCDAIQAFISRDVSVNLPRTRDLLFGRAVGRVVAHELLHIFAETATHSGHGVDHPTLTVQQLLADHLQFAELESTTHIVHTGPAPAIQSEIVTHEAGRLSYSRGSCITCHGADGKGTAHGPALRFTKRKLNSVTLLAKLAKNQDKMCQRAHAMKLATPSLGEDEISDLVRFLNAF
jgi:mono/diheme cytochrome c family protein